MPLPPGLSTVTVTGTYKHPDGTPLIGRVIFRPEPEILTSASYGTLVLGTVEGVLDTNGTFTATLLATDDPDVSPIGWTYRVTERWYDTVGRDYPIALPQAAPNVDIADIAPTAPTVGTYIVVTGPAGAAGAAGPPGPKGDKGDPGVSGGSPIVSYDGRIDLQIVIPPPTTGWAIVTTSGGTEIGWTFPATAGDRIWFSPSFLRTYGLFLDIGIKAAAGGVSRYVSSGTSTPETDGYAPLYPEAAFAGVVGMRQFTVQAGEVDGSGNAKIVLAYRGDSADGTSRKVYFGGGPGYSGALFVANMGPAPA